MNLFTDTDPLIEFACKDFWGDPNKKKTAEAQITYAKILHDQDSNNSWFSKHFRDDRDYIPCVAKALSTWKFDQIMQHAQNRIQQKKENVSPEDVKNIFQSMSIANQLFNKDRENIQKVVDRLLKNFEHKDVLFTLVNYFAHQLLPLDKPNFSHLTHDEKTILVEDPHADILGALLKKENPKTATQRGECWDKMVAKYRKCPQQLFVDFVASSSFDNPIAQFILSLVLGKILTN